MCTRILRAALASLATAFVSLQAGAHEIVGNRFFPDEHTCAYDIPEHRG